MVPTGESVSFSTGVFSGADPTCGGFLTLLSRVRKRYTSDSYSRFRLRSSDTFGGTVSITYIKLPYAGQI